MLVRKKLFFQLVFCLPLWLSAQSFEGILGGEFFLDGADPGFGNGQPMNISGASPVQVSIDLPSAGSISSGIHTLHVRILDSAGVWSLPEVFSFQVLPDSSIMRVSSIEYFIDEDPGVGLGTPFVVSNELTIQDIDDNINTSGLARGFHNLYTRALSSSGQWGPTEISIIYIDVSGIVSSIDTIEYFYDEDPGYGFGKIHTLSNITASVDVDEPVSTTGLIPGFHNYFVRPKLSGGVWGIPETSLVYVDESGLVIGVDTVEYFFDIDPGFGAADIISITSFDGAAAVINDSIKTDALNTGFHNLYIRPRFEGGTWGIPETKLVYVDPSGESSIIDTIEYFFDLDPGFGAAQMVNLTSGVGSTVDIDEFVPSSPIDIGFHTLHIRPRLEGGTWGMTQSSLVYVDASGGVTDIDTIEYFFDLDPGFGKGSIINLTSGINDTVNVNELVDATGLISGFHNLHLRAKLVGGHWGMTESSLVYVDKSGSILDIEEIEYYVDIDPGYGNALKFSTVSSPNDTIILSELVSHSLEPGFHNIFVRPKFVGGVWGISESQLVYVDQSGVSSLIDTAEYFFDVDPGYGNGTLVSEISTALKFHDLLGAVDASGLSLGFHNFYIRPRLEGGVWGIAESNLVYVIQVIDRRIAEVEYFIDTDPGFGNADKFSQSDSTLVLDIDEIILADHLLVGFHTITARPRYMDGSWGMEETMLFFIDKGGVEFLPVTEIEYFIGQDPGYGNANSIAFNPSSDTTMSLELLAQDLDSGNHHFTVRGRDVAGRWGIVDSRSFFNLPSSRALDSLSLLQFYKATNGPDWRFDNFWGATSMDFWLGVTIRNDRVTKLDLSSNLVSGYVPHQFGYIDQLDTVNLFDNAVSDSLPESFDSLRNLRHFDLSNNQLLGIPALQLTGLDSFKVDHNILGFEDIVPNLTLGGFSFHDQRILGDDGGDTILALGDSIELDHLMVGGNGNIYQWYLNGDSLLAFKEATIKLDSFAPSDTGLYHLEITNPSVPNYAIVSNTYRPRISNFQEDSLALVALYNSTGGENWINNTNWLTGALNTWSGVSIDSAVDNLILYPDSIILEVPINTDAPNSTNPEIVASQTEIQTSIPSANVLSALNINPHISDLISRRVVSLDLNANNLKGTIPDDFAYADAIMNLNLRGNEINDTIPESVLWLKNLRSLDISDNLFTELPLLAQLDSLDSVDLSSNHFVFDDLEKNRGFVYYKYAPQADFSPDDSVVWDINTAFIEERTIPGLYNNYKWTKNDQPFVDTSFLNFPSIQFEDEGIYATEVRNDSLPDLTIKSGLLKITVSSVKRDSVALLNLYQNTDGENWTDNSGWAVSPLSDWKGVKIEDHSVKRLILSGNNLSGSVPMELSNVTELDTIDLQSNNIEDLPDLSTLSKLSQLAVAGNKLHFDDLEPNVGISGIKYSPQQLVDDQLDTLIETGETLTFGTSVGGTSGLNYLWFKNNQEVSGENSSALSFNNVVFANEGTYHAEIKSSLVDGLTLSTATKSLRVSSLERDKLVLLELFDSTNGTNWTRKENWSESNTLSSQWSGVTVTDNRVVGLDLSNNNLSGDMPQSITDITSLTSANFSSNDLSGVADFSNHSRIGSLNVSSNRLHFDDLEPNVNVTGVVISPQKKIGKALTVQKRAGEEYSLVYDVGGSVEKYKWFRSSSELEDQTNDTLYIDSLREGDIGSYTLQIEGSEVDLTLETEPISLRVVTDINGTLYRTLGDQKLNDGSVTLYEVKSGPFDSLVTKDINSDGSYEFKDLLLGNYMLLSRPGSGEESLIQTYLGNTHLWEDADTLRLLQNSDGKDVDINLKGDPPELEKGDNEVFGVVETNFQNEATVGAGRVLARRRVRLAGVSLYRPRSELRSIFSTLDFIAYTTTDEDGNFSFDALPKGKYFINIQYPGVAMDTTSFIGFDLGDELDENKIELAAEITEEGIVVKEVKNVGVQRPYLKDIRIYPIPVLDKLNLEYMVYQSLNSLELEVWDNTGKLVVSKRLDHHFGRRTESLSLEKLASGLYHIKLFDLESRVDLRMKIIKD